MKWSFRGRKVTHPGKDTRVTQQWAAQRVPEVRRHEFKGRPGYCVDEG